MAKLRSMYQRVKFSEEILFCCINFFLSLCVYIQKFLLFRAFSSHEKIAFVYPSLDLAHTSSSPFLRDDASPFSEEHEIRDQPCKPHEIEDDDVPLEHTPLPYRSQLRYSPLRLPLVLHDYPLKYRKYLPVFDGENGSLTAKKHLDSFEHFVDLFEIEHEDVLMRTFAQSLQGEVKRWFRNLLPESISSWDGLSQDFLRFWGKRKSWDLFLSELYAMKRQSDETVSNFSRRFASHYYQMPEEIQPPEGTAKLYYAMAFHSDFSFYLLKRKSVSLQQMFSNAQEVEDNLIACGKLSDKLEDEALSLKKCENRHGQQEEADLELCLFRHEDNITTDYDQVVESPAVDPNPLAMDVQEVSNLPPYDEYTDDFDIFLLEQPFVCSSPGDDSFQQSYEGLQPTHFSHDDRQQKGSQFAKGKALPLCFSSFQFLKESIHHLINQQPYEDVIDPIVCYSKGFTNSSLQPSSSCEFESEDDEDTNILSDN